MKLMLLLFLRLERLSNFSKCMQLVNGKAKFQLGNYDIRAIFNYCTIELESHLGIMHKAQKS